MHSAEPEDGSLQGHVRHALEHLYDVDLLSEHWLIDRLSLTHEAGRGLALRQTLLTAIEQMRPDPQESPETPRWQMYQVLFQRYVQYTKAENLADQLGISSRHLRRLQNRAIAYLSEILLRGRDTDLEPSSGEAAYPSASVTPASVKAVDEEIGWLRDAALSEAVNVAAVWSEAVQLMAPLAKSAKVAMATDMPEDLPKVAIHPLGLRQILLSILAHLIENVGGREITVTASASPDQVHIVIHAAGGSAPAAALPAGTPVHSAPGLLLAQRVLSIFGGQLVETRRAGGHTDVQISLMIAGGTRILVIDDNSDILQLYHRYVAGTRYQLLVCDDSSQAMTMAISQYPKMIILDIMMPGIDGWSLLGKLRHHPATAAIPVIISTIVSERGLALALGADDFLQKPVTRTRFLAALDRQAASLGRAGC